MEQLPEVEMIIVVDDSGSAVGVDLIPDEKSPAAILFCKELPEALIAKSAEMRISDQRLVVEYHRNGGISENEGWLRSFEIEKISQRDSLLECLNGNGRYRIAMGYRECDGIEMFVLRYFDKRQKRISDYN